MSQSSMPQHPHAGVNYQEFIATICQQRDVSRYLEIGVSDGVNISKVSAETVYGVDPAFTLAVDPTHGKQKVHLYRTTSDTFFSRHAADLKAGGGIDLAFLDGMHLFEYLLRDFYNTEACCHSSGLITMHDCLPFDGEMIERVHNVEARTNRDYAGAWTGDVWKIVPLLKKYRAEPESHFGGLCPNRPGMRVGARSEVHHPPGQLSAHRRGICSHPERPRGR